VYNLQVMDIEYQHTLARKRAWYVVVFGADLGHCRVVGADGVWCGCRLVGLLGLKVPPSEAGVAFSMVVGGPECASHGICGGIVKE
jgi:hypothetical protein